MKPPNTHISNEIINPYAFIPEEVEWNGSSVSFPAAVAGLGAKVVLASALIVCNGNNATASLTYKDVQFSNECSVILPPDSPCQSVECEMLADSVRLLAKSTSQEEHPPTQDTIDRVLLILAEAEQAYGKLLPAGRSEAFFGEVQVVWENGDNTVAFFVDPQESLPSLHWGTLHRDGTGPGYQNCALDTDLLIEKLRSLIEKKSSCMTWVG